MKKNILLTVLLSFYFAQIFAQAKLQNVQNNSVLAVANAKVDGNLTEWGDNFQAYNKTTKLFYSLSNDDKNLYLVIKSADKTNIAKIEAGGVTFYINTADKKNEKDAFCITYPVVKRNGRGGGNARGRGGFGGNRGGVTLSDSAAKAATEEAHKQFIAASKEIEILGFKDITDTLISIYNEHSIKTAIGYNADGNFTYELAVPLKLLGLSANAPKEFAYNLTLNGIRMGNGQGGQGGGFGGGGGGFGGGGGGRGGGGGGRGGSGGGGGRGGNGGGVNIDFQDLITPTDFWGKYTLAKK